MADRCTHYLQQQAIQISVSDVASPWQNGHQESFYGRFKDEFGDMNRFDGVGEFLSPSIIKSYSTIIVSTPLSRCHRLLLRPMRSQILVVNNWVLDNDNIAMTSRLSLHCL